MFWIMIAVFKVTVWWIVDKCGDAVAKKPKDCDVTDQQVRNIIIREITAVKRSLNGSLKKDLAESIQFFKEGIEFLYDAIEQTRPRNEYGADTEQAACAEVMSLVERTRRNLELTESGTRQLKNAKDRFRSAREKATIAFSIELLSITDRILAMQYRVMATVLESIDHPEDAVLPCKLCLKELNGLPAVPQCDGNSIRNNTNPKNAVAPCKVCIEELNSLPVVQRSFKEQLRTGFTAVKSLFNKKNDGKLFPMSVLSTASPMMSHKQYTLKNHLQMNHLQKNYYHHCP